MNHALEEPSWTRRPVTAAGEALVTNPWTVTFCPGRAYAGLTEVMTTETGDPPCCDPPCCDPPCCDPLCCAPLCSLAVIAASGPARPAPASSVLAAAGPASAAGSASAARTPPASISRVAAARRDGMAEMLLPSGGCIGQSGA